MKQFRLSFATAILPAIFTLFLTFTSCQKDLQEEAVNSQLQSLPGAFKRTVTLHDGTTSVTLGIASDKLDRLTDFEAGLSIKSTAELSLESPLNNEIAAAEGVPTAIDETNAVHIMVITKELADGMQGFQLEVREQASTAGKTQLSDTYSGGPYNFYSWEAPHHFYVTPSGRCVSAWFFQAGSSWTPVSWKGGAAGYYLCTQSRTLNSSDNGHDFRLKAQGDHFYVNWN